MASLTERSPVDTVTLRSAPTRPDHREPLRATGLIETFQGQHDDDLVLRLLSQTDGTPDLGTWSNSSLANKEEHNNPRVDQRQSIPANAKPAVSTRAVRIAGMRKWEGYVEQVSDADFTAELTPLDHDGPVVLADFDLDTISPSDRAEIVPGASFYLAVRTVDRPGRGRSHTSSINVRRLGIWSSQVIQDLRARGRDAFTASERFFD